MEIVRSSLLSFKQNLALAALISVSPLALADGSLLDIDGLGGNSSGAFGVSADGTVVVGGAIDGALSAQPFRWTQAGGMTSLGFSGVANAVSGDGSIIVGQAFGTNIAFRWVAGTMTPLGTLAGGVASAASSVSDDGSVVVGNSEDASNIQHAFRWSTSGGVSGMVEVTNGFGGAAATAEAVSGNGNVIVGSAEDFAGHMIAYRWTLATSTMDPLGSLGGQTSTALGVSRDGSVVVGGASLASGGIEHAFRWTLSSNAMTDIGTLGGDNSVATATSADGSVVVGLADKAGGVTSAFRWTQAGGMLSVEQWLRDTGVTVADNLTNTAFDVSADGNVVVGVLNNSHAFVARGGSGIIDTVEYNHTLAGESQRLELFQQDQDRILRGTRGSPLRGLLPDGRAAFWANGDIGRNTGGDRRGTLGGGEIGLAKNVGGTLQFGLALGQTYSDADGAFDGRTRVRSTYILPEMTARFGATPLYGTVRALYAKGDADISRGYQNAGMNVISRGDPDLESYGVLARLDWRNAWETRALGLTPYVSMSYSRTKLDSYTESGGGFPAVWNGWSESATIARTGLDAVYAVNDKLNLLGTVEAAHRFESRAADVGGQVVGLYGFNFSGASVPQNWMRVAAGLEAVSGNSKTSATINGASGGGDPSFWLALSYRLMF
jgi:probable HAF family extracellular repeat protein